MAPLTSLPDVGRRSSDQITSLSEADFGDPRCGWRPVNECFAIFMHLIPNCPVCRLMQTVNGNQSGRRLHVIVTGEYLLVTEADDLHRPGRTLNGRRVRGLSTGAVYQLMPEPAQRSSSAGHVADSELAVLESIGARWRLRLTRHDEVLSHDHDISFEAQ
jgi:hypothetical protein